MDPPWLHIFMCLVSLFVNAQGRLTHCQNKCNDDKKNDMWQGKYLCGSPKGSSESEPFTKCEIECLGYEVAVNQTDCFCKYCKTVYADADNDEPPPYQDFCTEPGAPYIGEGMCDQMVCTGKAGYFGIYCRSTEKDLEQANEEFGPTRGALLRAVQYCDSQLRTATGEKILWTGKYKYYDIIEPWHLKFGCWLWSDYDDTALFFTRSLMECISTLVANKAQIHFDLAPHFGIHGITDCQCRYCKKHPLNYKSFCVKPGWQAHIEKDECDSQVCKGEAIFHGGYCNPDSMEVIKEGRRLFDDDVRRKRIRQCNVRCIDASGEDAWKGISEEEPWCGYYEDIPVISTQCWKNCINEQRHLFPAGDILNMTSKYWQCQRDYCKYDPMNYVSFCTQKGFRAHIQQDQCDSLVHPGKAQFHGAYCNPKSPEEFEEAEKQFSDDPFQKMHKCWEKCGGDTRHYLEMWNGNLACAFDSKDCSDGKSSSWNSKCYWDCMGKKIAKDQTACACDYCKSSPLAHVHFCEDNGIKTYVDKDCDMHVCNGTVKYHGKFCNFKTQGEIDHALSEYGVTSDKWTKCLATCGGEVGFHKTYYRGELVCLILESNVGVEKKQPRYYSKCLLDCLGHAPAEDQNECACNYCKLEAGPADLTNRGFCPKPGMYDGIPADGCAETACNGKFTFYGEYCNKTEEEIKDLESKYGETLEEREQKCVDFCSKNDIGKDMLMGKLVCTEVISEDGSLNSFMISRCFLECMGYQEAPDQNKCACNYCNGNSTFPNDVASSDFCLKPGPQASIDKADCDRLVCTGEAKYYGIYCYSSQEDIAAARKKYGLTKRKKPPTRCYELCELIEDWDKEMWHGQFVCGYQDDDNTKPYMDTRCLFDCKGLQIAEDQTKCLCDYCKDKPPNHLDFCEKPGWKAKISRDQCDELVCTGKAKYYRTFCNPATKKEITEAEEKFGESNNAIETKNSCWKECNEKEWYKEMYRGEHECAYLKSGPIYFPFMEQKCVLECLNIQRAKSQRKCSFQYCYDSPLNSHGFCSAPGVNAAITKDDCYRMVQRGNTTYHGVFCDLHTEEEFEEAKKEYGE